MPLSICAVTGVPLDPDNNWSLDLDRVAAAIRPNTKLVSINFPHNPTGRIIEHAVLNGLVDLCRRHGLWLFSDEVYRLLGPDPDKQVPQVADLYERGLSLNVMSKAYGLPGLRIGRIACCRSRPARPHGTDEALPLDLQFGAERASRDHCLRNRAAILARNNAPGPRQSRPARWLLRRIPRPVRMAPARWRLSSVIRAGSAPPASMISRRRWSRRPALLLPSSIYSSSLGPTPTDRFRIGFGRAGTAEGLAAFRAYAP